jgi:hypothetical protein
MWGLDSRGGDLRHLTLRNIHPFLTIRKAGVIELAFLHEVKASRRRGLPSETSYGNTGLLFRWFWRLRPSVFRGSIVWFGEWIREGINQINES